MNGYVRDTIEDDIIPLSRNLRDADVAEILAASGMTPEAALLLGFSGDICKTMVAPDGTPVGIFGTNPTTVDGLGSIWMVATKDFNKVQRQFLRECRDGIRELSKGYKALFNYTDARNHIHHRWLKWCGFVFINKHNRGVNGEEFIEFCRITEINHV